MQTITINVLWFVLVPFLTGWAYFCGINVPYLQRNEKGVTRKFIVISISGTILAISVPSVIVVLAFLHLKG